MEQTSLQLHRVNSLRFLLFKPGPERKLGPYCYMSMTKELYILIYKGRAVAHGQYTMHMGHALHHGALGGPCLQRFCNAFHPSLFATFAVPCEPRVASLVESVNY